MINFAGTSLTVDELRLNEQVKYFKSIMESGADGVHFDIMDGTITEYKTKIDYAAINKILNKMPDLKFDIHYMSSAFEDLRRYIATKPSVIFLHITQYIDAIDRIKEGGVSFGLAIDAVRNIKDINVKVLNAADCFLVMGVKIGKSGQKFGIEAVNKIKTLKKYNKDIFVDGGLDEVTTKQCTKAGAEYFSYGSYLYNAYLNNNLSQKTEALHK